MILDEDYSIKKFNLYKAPDKEFFKLFKLLDELFRETEKDDPLPTNEFRLKNFKHKDPNFDEFWWFVWDKNNNVIGFSFLSVRTKISPSFDENKHVSYCQIRIKKEHRRKGIGLECLKEIIQTCKNFDFITTLQGSTHYESGFTFNEKLNGVLAMDSTTNRCKLSDVNWDLMKEWREQGQIRAKEENRQLQWFEKCPEELIEPFCNVYTETMNQQPLGEIETRAKITPESRRITEQEFDELDYIWTTVITREKDGAISGITDVTYIPSRSYRIEQELTGVKVEYREKD